MSRLNVFSAFNQGESKAFFTEFKQTIKFDRSTIAFRLALEGIYYIGDRVIKSQSFKQETMKRIDTVFQYLRQQDRHRKQRPEENRLADAFAQFVNLKRISRNELSQYFENDEEKRNAMFDSLVQAGKQQDLLITVLALQALHCMENDSDLHEGQWNLGLNDCEWTESFRECLREWRKESQCLYYKSDALKYLIRSVLEALEIFKHLKVPLFIDNYGHKETKLSTEIDGDTPIYHDTHKAEADQIVEDGKLKPSDNKNIIPGVWFGLYSNESAYGSHRFETTLSRLGVTGLRQGEIVAYKNEINVILYAHKDPGGDFSGLKWPTDAHVKTRNPNAYVHISIFVPENVLPNDNWDNVLTDPFEVQHGPICVRQKRTGKCPDKPEQRTKTGICDRYNNTGECNPNCVYRHVCEHCGREHPRQLCP